MITLCFKRIDDVWFGLALDEEKRVVSCGFSLKSRYEVVDRVLAHIKIGTSITETVNDEYALAIIESLRRIFWGKEPKTVPKLALEEHSEFKRMTLTLTLKIPKGSVATYHGIAEGIGYPKAARAVGRAEAENPFAPFVPCHRVVSSSLRLGGYGSGLQVKRDLLMREGVVFNGERVSPSCLWTPKN
jgi:methylated-DNA-[protein]-cysteine S-methyltransferase